MQFEVHRLHRLIVIIIRLYTGDDGESHFETTTMDMHAHGDVVTMSDLMECHEVQFAETSSGGGYDWHADVGYRGSTAKRRLSATVQLSKPGDYDGGALQVGATNVSLGRGDLHVYRASTPHRVYEVTRGVRRTPASTSGSR